MADDLQNNLKLVDDSIGKVRKCLTVVLNIIVDCSKELLIIADNLDDFHRKATIANVTGSLAGIAGGITTIAGFALAPFTAGASLSVIGYGVSVAAVGGITGASASIADTVNMKKKCSRVEEIVKVINAEMNELDKASKILDSLIAHIMSQQNILEGSEAARAGGRRLYAAIAVGTLIQLGKVSAAAARGMQIAARFFQVFRLISGIFAALFMIFDAHFFAEGVKEINSGCKTDEAKKIRECVVEINKVHEGLQNLDKELMPLAPGCN
ncbi:apolipoprotein L3-like [Phyllobates terribilis]|uniref:apolipoprotein L3-like n=1 Tax=Phyllobates terribilis TaxID=111132 RepID=UPI003CCAA023